MSRERINEIKARWASATSGTWGTWNRGVGWEITTSSRLSKWGTPADLLPEGQRTSIDRAEDAAFIAEAHQDIPWLVEQLEQLRFLRGDLIGYTRHLAEHVDTFDDPDPEHETRLILRDLQARLGLTPESDDAPPEPTRQETPQ